MNVRRMSVAKPFYCRQSLYFSEAISHSALQYIDTPMNKNNNWKKIVQNAKKIVVTEANKPPTTGYAFESTKAREQVPV